MRAVSSVIVRRQERRAAPEMPAGEIVLQPPPEIPEVVSDGLQQMMTYLPMLAMTFGMVAMMSGSGSGSLRWVGGGAMGLGMGGMALSQLARGKGDRKLKLNGQRRDYLRYLGQVRRKVRRAASAQRTALEWTSPPPAALWWAADGQPAGPAVGAPRPGRRLRQRPARHRHAAARGAPGAAADQAGRGSRRAVRRGAAPVRPDSCPGARAAGRHVAAHLPAGRRDRRFVTAGCGMVRAVLGQLAVFHSPEDVRICVCAPPDRISALGMGQVAAAQRCTRPSRTRPARSG